MSIEKATIVVLVALLIGSVTGLTFGYVLWAQDVTQLGTLSHELDKTRTWLLDEINWSDERCDQVSAALSKAQADLAQARREVLRGGSARAGDVRPPAVSEAATPETAR